MRSRINLSGDMLGLDLGMSRTGVARINVVARIPEPLQPIVMTELFCEQVHQLVKDLDVSVLVVGMPRGLDGQETEQTKWAESMLAQLEDIVGVPVFSVDEAGTTIAAEARAVVGQSIDSVAAGIIAEDFLNEVLLGRVEDVNVSA